MTRNPNFDAIIMGGGFYGCCIALLLAEHFPRVAIVEREADLLQRASLINQARVHGGYHYPRSIMTAARSQINLPRFAMDFRAAIVDNFTKLYGIARHGSKVNAGQFYNFFKKSGAEINPAPSELEKFFNPLFVEAAFTVREMAFDGNILRQLLRKQLEAKGIHIILSTEITGVQKTGEQFIVEGANSNTFTASHIFNCLYARINFILGKSNLPLAPLRHELTEMALIEPGPFAKLGLTIMDGPFFSLMPYPARQLHSLSHVRYTPHTSWEDAETPQDGYALLAQQRPASNFDYMQRDAARYVPLIDELKQVDSLFEIKTTLTQNNHDDGRPIWFHEEPSLPHFYTVMGGKIDNIYDILDVITETQPHLNQGALKRHNLFGT